MSSLTPTHSHSPHTPLTHLTTPQVFDCEGRGFTPLRTLGAGLLKIPCGVCVDGSARVYVCDNYSKAVVVLDGASGSLLATINIPGFPMGVTLTRRGAIVVTHAYPDGIVVVGP